VAAVGVDGTRGGWVAAVVGEGRLVDVSRVATLAEVVERAAGAPVAVDIPIGLVDAPRRDADVAARALLPGAASSVFPAPCRSVVDAYRGGSVSNHAAASAMSRQVVGAGMSAQTWHILDKITEADDLIAAGADLHEVHPELCFRLRAGRPLAPKRSWNGVMARLSLLREVGLDLPDVVDGGDSLPPDDVLDAAIAAWTAAGAHLRGGLRSHPDPPTQWDRGRPIVIWTRP
jgi:predicted RNase H-like nuclease